MPDHDFNEKYSEGRYSCSPRVGEALGQVVRGAANTTTKGIDNRKMITDRKGCLWSNILMQTLIKTQFHETFTLGSFLCVFHFP